MTLSASVCQRTLVLEANRQWRILDEEKPVAAPGNVAGNLAEFGNRYLSVFPVAVAGDVIDSHRVLVQQIDRDNTDRGFEFRDTVTDFPEVGQCDGGTDGSVPAHAEITRVVEKEDARNAVISSWLAKQSPDQRIRTPRLEDHGPAHMIELVREPCDALLQGAAAEVGPAFHDDSRWLAFSMGIDYSHVTLASGGGAGPATPPLPELPPMLLEKGFLRWRQLIGWVELMFVLRIPLEHHQVLVVEDEIRSLVEARQHRHRLIQFRRESIGFVVTVGRLAAKRCQAQDLFR